MNISRLTRVALVAALAFPAAAQAQIEQLKFAGVKFPSAQSIGSYKTGPYRASRAPFTAADVFDIYCIDLDHNAKSQWTAHYVTFNEAIGVHNLEATRQLGAGFDLGDLRTAAYLSNQFSVTPQNNWASIHGQIWSLFSTNGAVSSYAAAAAVSKGIAGGNAAWDSYALILDENAFAANYNPRTANLNQAMITELGNTTITVVTPEPSTYVLLGAGLLAIGFVSRRRRTV